MNLSPSLSTDTPLDLKVKSQMLAQLFTLVSIEPYDRGQHKRDQHQKQAERFTRLARGTSAVEQRVRPQTPAGALPPDAVRAVRQMDEEASKSGGWRRAFPVADGHTYRPFFAKERPLNWLLCDILARRARGEPDVGPFAASELPAHAAANAGAAAAVAAAAAAATPAAGAAPMRPGSPDEKRRHDATRPISACPDASSSCLSAACAAKSGSGEAAAAPEAACGRRPPSAIARVNVEAYQGSWATPVDASSTAVPPRMAAADARMAALDGVLGGGGGGGGGDGARPATVGSPPRRIMTNTMNRPPTYSCSRPATAASCGCEPHGPAPPSRRTAPAAAAPPQWVQPSGHELHAGAWDRSYTESPYGCAVGASLAMSPQSRSRPQSRSGGGGVRMLRGERGERGEEPSDVPSMLDAAIARADAALHSLKPPAKADTHAHSLHPPPGAVLAARLAAHAYGTEVVMRAYQHKPAPARGGPRGLPQRGQSAGVRRKPVPATARPRTVASACASAPRHSQLQDRYSQIRPEGGAFRPEAGAFGSLMPISVPGSPR